MFGRRSIDCLIAGWVNDCCILVMCGEGRCVIGLCECCSRVLVRVESRRRVTPFLSVVSSATSRVANKNAPLEIVFSLLNLRNIIW
jgi:hypothetical protein